MLSPFQSFDEGQPVFYPVILNVQGFFWPVHQNSIVKAEELDAPSAQNNGQMAGEVIKIEEGVGLSHPDTSAFKTTKDNSTTIGSSFHKVSPQQKKNNPSQTSPTAPRRPPRQRACVSQSNYEDSVSLESEVGGKAVRGSWKKEEEERLVQLVELFGKHWKHISEHLPNRNPKQIRQRYLNYLRANISNEKWTPEEDSWLLSLVEEYGHRWKLMEKKMKKRSQNQLKNRYYGHLRKQQAKSLKPQLDLGRLRQPPQEHPLQGNPSSKPHPDSLFP